MVTQYAGRCALLMTWQNSLVLSDVGFQLTTAATLSILLYGDRHQAWRG